jgi:polar amino acid transport system substrate-binding protein
MNKYLIILLVFFTASASAGEEIKVGVYDFPPYAFTKDKVSGITVQMLALLNKFQQKYEFQAVATTPKRRYGDFEKNKFDMMIFENKAWGWLEYPVTVSQAFLRGGEVYVTLAKPGRDQSFFTDFKQKSMIGVLGYHYEFANFNADIAYLHKKFTIELTDGQQKSLQLILNDRGEIAVIPKAYLNYYFGQNPKDKSKLLISDKMDQVYRHTILLRKKHPKITIRDINKLLFQLKKQKVLEPLWKEHGLGDALLVGEHVF